MHTPVSFDIEADPTPVAPVAGVFVSCSAILDRDCFLSGVLFYVRIRAYHREHPYRPGEGVAETDEETVDVYP